jgi:hypothetical protein
MVEPIRCLDEWGSIANCGVGDADSVGRGTELNLLAQFSSSCLGVIGQSPRRYLFSLFDLTDEAKPFAGNRFD